MTWVSVVWLLSACPQGTTAVAPLERVAVGADEAASAQALVQAAASATVGACATTLDDATVQEAVEAGCDFGPCLRERAGAWALLGGAVVRAGGALTVALRALVGPGLTERTQTVALDGGGASAEEARRLEAAVQQLLDGAPRGRVALPWARTAAWIGVGLTVVALGLAAGLGAGVGETTAALQQQRVTCPSGMAYSACAQRAYVDGGRLATATNVAWVSAGVLGVLTGAAWVLSL